MIDSLSHLPLSPSGLDEELARAEVYGLLSRLFLAAPDAELLAALRVAPTEAPASGAFLEEPWRELVGSARMQAQSDIAAEYDALFGGVGKPEVYLFGSHWQTGFLNDKPLVSLRADLSQLGLTRDPAAAETEDHVAYLLEVMRFLIAGEDVSVSNLTQQRAFFTRHIQPWIADCLAAVQAHPRARFYATLAAFAQAFLSVETQGFDLLE